MAGNATPVLTNSAPPIHSKVMHPRTSRLLVSLGALLALALGVVAMRRPPAEPPVAPGSWDPTD